MTIDGFLTEFEIDISQVRYYLSKDLAFRILSMKDKPQDLIKYIKTGQLHDELYNMEENFLNDLTERYNSGKIDFPAVKEQAIRIIKAGQK